MPRNQPAYLGIKGTEKSYSEQCFPNLSGLRALVGSLTSVDSHYHQNEAGTALSHFILTCPFAAHDQFQGRCTRQGWGMCLPSSWFLS